MNTRVINNSSCHLLNFYKFTNWLFTECPLCPSHFLWSVFLSVWLMFKYIYKERNYFDQKVYLIVMNHLSKYSNMPSIGSCSGEHRQIPGSTGCCGIIPVKWHRKLKIEVHQGPRRRGPVTSLLALISLTVKTVTQNANWRKLPPIFSSLPSDPMFSTADSLEIFLAADSFVVVVH